MTTRKPLKSWKLAMLLMLPALQACSTISALQQPSTHKLQVTPLPAEISQINTSDSQPWLQKAQDWLGKVSSWSSAEMPK